MWIFTVRGFFTFVTDRKDHDYLWLRARMREHIEDNFPGVTAEAKPGADYLWRAKVKRADVAERIAELVMESTVDSHFKDVMIKTAAKPKTGNLSKVMYAVWNGAAEWQEYAPYSKIPRSAAPKPTWKGSTADRKPGTGQQSILEPYVYGGTGSTRYGSDFDWDARDWGGTQAADPVRYEAVPDDYTDEEWRALSAEDQQRALDAEEAQLRALEAMSEDQGALARLETLGATVPTFAYPAPRNRPGTRKGRKGRKRSNRHNQRDPLGDRVMDRDRQTYLAKQARKSEGKA
jgi:hypothetical protein